MVLAQSGKELGLDEREHRRIIRLCRTTAMTDCYGSSILQCGAAQRSGSYRQEVRVAHDYPLAIGLLAENRQRAPGADRRSGAGERDDAHRQVGPAVRQIALDLGLDLLNVARSFDPVLREQSAQPAREGAAADDRSFKVQR
jgi:hypothetical protein